MTERVARVALLALVGVALTGSVIGCQTGSGSAEGDQSGGLAGRIEALQVLAPSGAGYERERFGDYDRDQALDQNRRRYPDCDGYYSMADDACYTSADDVQIDHTVALAEAWASGAHGWPQGRLDKFAADPDNLAVMTSGLNMAKSDDDPADWLPPHEPYRCDYIDTYVRVKGKYDLAVDKAEQRTLLRVARGCVSNRS